MDRTIILWTMAGKCEEREKHTQVGRNLKAGNWNYGEILSEFIQIVLMSV
jgi:hypothetical protein